MAWGIKIRDWRFQVQTPRGAQLGLGIQPRSEASGDLWVEIVEAQWLKSGEWGCPLNNEPKIAVGQPNSSWKNALQVLIKVN